MMPGRAVIAAQAIHEYPTKTSIEAPRSLCCRSWMLHPRPVRV